MSETRFGSLSAIEAHYERLNPCGETIRVKCLHCGNVHEIWESHHGLIFTCLNGELDLSEPVANSVADYLDGCDCPVCDSYTLAEA